MRILHRRHSFCLFFAAILLAAQSLAAQEPAAQEPAAQEPAATDTASDSISDTLERRASLVKSFDDRFTPEWLKTIRGKRQSLLAAVGLDINVAYDSLALAAVGGGDVLFAASGELSVSGIWKIVGDERGRPIDLQFRLRTRDAYGDRAPSALGGDIGAFWGVTDGFSDRGFEIPEFYFKQRFLRRDIELRYGQLSVESQLDRHALRGAKRAFINRAFSSNPAVPFPRFGAGATLQWKSKTGYDITGVVTTVQATKEGDQVDLRFESSDLFEAIQFGRDFTGLDDDPARLQVMVWRSDAIEAAGISEGYGVAATLEQEITPIDSRAFFRYAWADGESTALTQFAAGGIGKTLREFDLLGVALGGGRSSRPGGGWQTVTEAFYRWQIGPEGQVTPGVQVLLGDGFTGGGDLRVIFGIRGQLSF